MLDRKRALDAFSAYAGAFDMGDARVALKYEHTLRVAGLCEEIAAGLGMGAGDVELAWLCGLLHDIGRFEQLRIWGTFRDADSCSHARLGLAVLDGEQEFAGRELFGADGRLERFVGAGADAVGCDGADAARGDADASVADAAGSAWVDFDTSDAARAGEAAGVIQAGIGADAIAIICDAVALHSDFRLPGELNAHTRRFCEVVRDADKVDILRVFGESDVRDVLGLTAEQFAAGEVSDEAMVGFREHRCLGPADKRASLDNFVGVLCFSFELVHEPSRIALARLGYLQQLLDRPFGLEPTFANPDTAAKYKEICQTLGD